MISPADFGKKYMTGFALPKHVQEFQRATLQLLNDKDISRICVEAPVRHGKSYWWSVLVPAWLCVTRPHWSILGVSYGLELSKEFSRQILQIVEKAAPDYDLEIDPKWKRVDSFRWRGGTGGYQCTSAIGGINGRGFHWITADDLVRDAEEARSVMGRENLKTWFFGDCLSRLEPGGKIAMVMSRRHPSDIMGECLRMNSELPKALKWKKIQFKAIGDDGKALWPARYSLDWLRAKKREYELAARAHDWHALFQQDPRGDPSTCEWANDLLDILTKNKTMENSRLTVVACDPRKGDRAEPGSFRAIAIVDCDWQGSLLARFDLQQRDASDCAADFAAEITGLRFVAAPAPDAAVVDCSGGCGQIAKDVRGRLDLAKVRIPLHSFVDAEKSRDLRIRLDLTEFLKNRKLSIVDDEFGKMAIRQFEEFPSGKHDTALNALSLAIRLIRELILKGC